MNSAWIIYDHSVAHVLICVSFLLAARRIQTEIARGIESERDKERERIGGVTFYSETACFFYPNGDNISLIIFCTKFRSYCVSVRCFAMRSAHTQNVYASMGIQFMADLVLDEICWFVRDCKYKYQ